MKKILAVFDGNHYSENVLHFINNLNQLSAVSVTGIFLSSHDYAHLWSNPAMQETLGSLSMVKEELELADKGIESNISRFENYCLKEGLPFRVHDESGSEVFETLRYETRFADLMILSNDLFYKNIGEQPNEYLQQILHASECAVLMLPEKENFPDHLILCYDGSPSSVFAIKQFAYILPELCDREAILLSREEEDQIRQHPLLEELAVRHFPALSLQILDKTEGNKPFSSWVNSRSHPMVVAGAFSRSGISRLFKKSFIAEVIKENNASVFIAHK